MWRCKDFNFNEQTSVLVGIINLTPDSFSDGGLYQAKQDALKAAHKLIEDGAHIIDVGGESTRPGAQEVPPEEEIRRTCWLVRKLADEGVCVSIDTRHAQTARAALEAGASIINDISGFRDSEMVSLAQKTDVGLIVMHMQGQPDTMQNNPLYDDVVSEVATWLKKQAEALQTSGIDRERICIDPGPGFGKTTSQTKELVAHFHSFARLGYPVMCAVSRKSFIGELYGIEDPPQRDKASAAEALAACEMGATIIRTHNIAETAQALTEFRPLVVLSLDCNVAEGRDVQELRQAKIAQLKQAISKLCSIPDSLLIDISSFYASEPAYVEDQDEFVNVIVFMRCGIEPHQLLTYLHAIENSLGRVRTIKNGPRTCDIDIIDYQLYTTNDDELTLPHPRVLERDFVVKPLEELRPHFIFADGSKLDDAKPAYGKATRLLTD